MHITITHEGFTLTDDIKDLIENKISPQLDKYLNSLPQDQKLATMSIVKEGYYFTVKFDLWLPDKKHIFTSEQGEELLTVIYQVRDEVERQLVK